MCDKTVDINEKQMFLLNTRCGVSQEVYILTLFLLYHLKCTDITEVIIWAQYTD